MIGDIHALAVARIAALFDRPCIQNNLRGLYVEMMIAEILKDGWRLTGEDWAAWDLEHADGTRLEVRQSAARQSWTTAERAPESPPRFSIRAPKKIWLGSQSLDTQGRPADIYIFAWHSVRDASADHRNPEQWRFFVAPAAALPDQSTIGLARLHAFAAPVGIRRLAGSIENLRRRIGPAAPPCGASDTAP